MLRPLLESGVDLRMHGNNGAVASFVDTIPLLHPYGRLIYYDTVVSEPLPTKFSFTGPFALSRRIQNKAYSTADNLVRALEHVLNTGARVLAAVEATIAARIHQTLGTFPADKLIINPDCGLRHLPAHVARSKLARDGRRNYGSPSYPADWRPDPTSWPDLMNNLERGE